MIDVVVDFTNKKRKKKAYGGANGNKISIIHSDKLHMLKFPNTPTVETKLSYIHNCFSEYIGSHIFEIVGIKTQKTQLGVFMNDNKLKFVVACEDFTNTNEVIQDFASMKNQIINSKYNGYGTNLEEIIDTIEKQNLIDKEELKNFFWDMFIVDAFIGNWDRHNGNWGFLYNNETDEIKVAPIYDCGSSLFHQIDEKMIYNVLFNEKELDKRVYEIPTSAIKLNNKRINYFDFISSLQNKDCNEALKRIVPKIDMNRINALIDNIPLMSTYQQEFYKKVLKARKEKILDYSYNLLIKKD
ncbi:MAG: HipA domain-containing protein [Bacilli bacterium]|nr:HipA domain-containing protein [Bacilli bacterium]